MGATLNLDCCITGIHGAKHIMKLRNVIGPQIRRFRSNLDWSQSALALKLQGIGWEISKSEVAKIEAQLIWVTDFEVRHFARVFGINLSELFPKMDSKKRVDQVVTKLLNKINVPKSGA